MSSRTGKVLTGEWLLDEVKKMVLKRMESSTVEFSPGERESTADKIAVGAVKYALLKAGIGHDVIFDFGKSVSLEGNSGPYLQYTYARTQSVLQKSEIRNPCFAGRQAKSETISKSEIRNYKLNNEELTILRWIYRFPEVVMEAARQYAPNLMCTFLYELAQRYNSFYNKHRIINLSKINQQSAINNQQSSFRLLLTAAVGQVLKNGLTLLGIQTPEKM